MRPHLKVIVLDVDPVTGERNSRKRDLECALPLTAMREAFSERAIGNGVIIRPSWQEKDEKGIPMFREWRSFNAALFTEWRFYEDPRNSIPRDPIPDHLLVLPHTP